MENPHVTNVGQEVSMLSKLSPHTVVERETPFWYYGRKHLIFSTINSTEEGRFSL